MKTIAIKSENNMSVVANNVRMNDQTNVLSLMKQQILKSSFVVLLAQKVSLIIGEKVSEIKTLHLLNCIVAGISALFFGGFSILVQVLLLAWFGISFWQCKKDGWK